MTKISVEQELYKAKVHEKKGEITEAKNIYLDILRVFPKNLRVQKKLAELNVPKQTDPTCPSEEVIKRLIKLINQNEYSVVVNQAQVLAQQFPDSFIIWNILGVVNKSLGNLIEASKSFKIPVNHTKSKACEDERHRGEQQDRRHRQIQRTP